MSSAPLTKEQDTSPAPPTKTHGKHLRPVELAQVEDEISTSYERKYLFRRPHPRQYIAPENHHGGGAFQVDEYDVEGILPAGQKVTPSQSNTLAKSASIEDTDSPERRLQRAKVTERQRRQQFDLLLDLVMVAFIANLAETFSEEAFGVENEQRDTGGAFLTYSMSFTLVGRIWKDLRMFMNQFFVDDFLQRMFIAAILCIVIVLAGVAPALNIHSPQFGHVLNGMITSYTIVRAAFGLMFLYYGLMLPWLRRIHAAAFLLTLPCIALWIGTIYTRMPSKVVIFFVALSLELVLDKVSSLPAYTKYVTKGWKMQTDYDHYLERITAFLTILLGSGIELLINQSPAGHSIEPLLRFVVPGFMIIYFLYYLYSNSAYDPVYLHAVRRSWRVDVLWEFLHVPLFASVPILGVSLSAISSLSYADREQEAVEHILRTAQWISASVLSVIILLMTIIALLNKPIKAPNQILVDNRYVRMAPRLIIVIIIPCLPLKLDPVYHIGTLAGLIAGVSVFEFLASWRKDGKVFEPKNVGRAEEEAEPQPQPQLKVVEGAGS